jgi:putative colanic acid biosynthesis UDP-glucose lipid carrier transferase
MQTVEEQFNALDMTEISKVTTERRQATRKSGRDAQLGIPILLRSFKLEHKTPHANLKRICDLLLSGVGLIGFGLVFPVIAFGIKLSSKGPVFFKQARTGQGGKPFICLKFRTMHMVEKDTGDKPAVTKKGDPRLFAFGQLLRKFNLDELPQLINVFKGDMSLVGPRPYMLDECKYWNQKFDDYFIRYAVKPGISGLAQVKGYRGGTYDEEHMRKRLDYDLVYIEKQSLTLDFKIILKTVYQMITHDTGAH